MLLGKLYLFIQDGWCEWGIYCHALEYCLMSALRNLHCVSPETWHRPKTYVSIEVLPQELFLLPCDILQSCIKQSSFTKSHLLLEEGNEMFLFIPSPFHYYLFVLMSVRWTGCRPLMLTERTLSLYKSLYTCDWKTHTLSLPPFFGLYSFKLVVRNVHEYDPLCRILVVLLSHLSYCSVYIILSGIFVCLQLQCYFLSRQVLFYNFMRIVIVSESAMKSLLECQRLLNISALSKDNWSSFKVFNQYCKMLSSYSLFMSAFLSYRKMNLFGHPFLFVVILPWSLVCFAQD